MACGVRVAELARVDPTDQIMIIGMGPIGLFVLHALIIHGVTRIIAVDTNPDRLAIAEGLGAIVLNPKESSKGTVDVIKQLTKQRGVDVAIDAVGASVTRTQCVECVVPSGKVIFTGLHESESVLPINTMIRNEI